MSVAAALTRDGIEYRAGVMPADWFLDSEDPGGIGAFVSQLEELGLVEHRPDRSLLLRWKHLYSVLAEEDLFPPQAALPVPPVDEAVVPSLRSAGSLSDPDFRITVSGWQRDGTALSDRLDLVGPVSGDEFTLSATVFELVQAVARFARLPSAERTPSRNRELWAEIRALALSSGAGMDQFLRTTIVLKPSMLGLGLERVHVGADVAVRVSPTFEDAPKLWLQQFDRKRRASSHYRLVEPGGEYVEVQVEDAVLEVLQEIKRLPNRIAAGDRARRLVENPIAYFDTAQKSVFDAAAVERELAALQADTWSFRPQISLDGNGRVEAVALELERQSEEPETDLRLFSAPAGLAEFVRLADSALGVGQRFFAWSGLELELGTQSSDHLGVLRDVLDVWTPAAPSDGAGAAPAAAGLVITADLVLDLARYHDRVESIGVQTPYGIITVPLNKKGAWLNEDQEVKLLVSDGAGGTTSVLELDREQLQTFVREVRQATAQKHDSVAVPGGGYMPLRQAADIVDALPAGLLDEVDETRSTPEPTPREPPSPRVGLLIKSNIDDDDYVTQRDDALRPDEGAAALLPASLRPDVQLKDHQLRGLVWLQHLFAQSPTTCRGGLLADDMGLGKTLQSLALIARAREDDPDLPPALVVAPVTLLENWSQEIRRFFADGSLPFMTLYGAELRAFRVNRNDIDERLRVDGLQKFLRPGWHEGQAIVLTTYETLRDYEFSFGEVRWSIVVCDEAQRIKNPNALVTRAAKKLNARFCVAATGTPVENNLTDLWSLFDFIQPGLLEPLNRFNRNYRRPIEAKTETQIARLNELRRLIDPQILRRTKQDVARDLPAKLFDADSRKLPMSDRQRELYESALAAQRMASSAQQNGTDMLQLISTLRRICTDPRSARELAEPLPPLAEYRTRAPKLDWLMRTLAEIEARTEKAIVFMDRKNVQRLVQAYVREHFGFTPEIINGETPTGGASPDSRQKRIDRFQARPGFSVLILSPVAAGVGLNIQAANHVVHYMRHWNPAKEDQATDRAYRIGQERDVHVYTPIVCGDGWVSFDERLDELLDKKRSIATDILNGSDDIGAAEFADLIG